MGDRETHNRAMALVDEAGEAQASGRLKRARDLFAQAAQIEQSCADAAGGDQPRTQGILRISAVSMWREAGELGRARALAQRYLDAGLSTGFARELHELLATIDDEIAALEHVPAVSSGEAEQLLRALGPLEEEIAKGTVPRVAVRNAA
ncbi:MAG: hypothetical protein K8H88_24480 [Sandaracinaceae bacterium]|nr:hypothetical protein [Sandaracinaceae bacterium]